MRIQCRLNEPKRRLTNQRFPDPPFKQRAENSTREPTLTDAANDTNGRNAREASIVELANYLQATCRGIGERPPSRCQETGLQRSQT